MPDPIKADKEYQADLLGKLHAVLGPDGPPTPEACESAYQVFMAMAIVTFLQRHEVPVTTRTTTPATTRAHAALLNWLESFRARN